MSRKPRETGDPDRTGPQVVASDPTQSVWVTANAGTGKTHVLIERILRLLLAGTSPRRILALTFTKAAAAEVATRLSDRLGGWAAASDDALEKDLRALLRKPPSDGERATARRLFATILETPEGLNVRTIHSFAESLLGRFPIEAEVPPHFTVIDERRAAEIRSEAQGRLFAAAATGRTTIGDAMARLAGLVTADDFHKLMANLDRERGRLRRVLKRPGGLASLVSVLRRRQGIAAGDTVDSLTAAASRDGAFDALGLQRAAKALDAGSAADRERAEAIRRWLKLEAARRGERFLDDYAPIYMTNEQKPRANIATKKAREKDSGAVDILLAEQERVAAEMARAKSVAIAEATEALITVGRALLDDYDAVKRASALRDYDDLIDDAGRLLATDDGVSWVHYKLDGGIDHVLVDEAQDTSPDQWRVIERLAGDFFSGLGASDDDRVGPRTVFAVGDEKQSIFSFQGADPAVFGRTRGHFAAKTAAIGARLQDVELERSHRSSPAVLKVVDRVFENPAARDGLSFGSDRPIVHHTERLGQAGLVELWPTLTPDDTPDPRPWDWPFDKPSPASPQLRLADRIAATIRDWLDRGEILESAARPIAPGDVMILVRTRGTFADQMVKALERRHIPVAGRDRLKLLDHIAVMDLMAAGRFALLLDDDLNTATVLKGPFVGLDDEALFELAYEREATLWETLTSRADERPDFAAARRTLGTWLERADMTPPFEFYSRLLGEGGRQRLIARLGAEVAEPVEGFLAQALDFERDHEPSLEAFLHWLELGNTEIKREMERGRDQVRVLTVHGAKGLEAGIVFLPDTCTLPEPRLDPRIHWGDGHKDDDEFVLWRPAKDDEDGLAATLHADARAETEREYRRLLYVAMTRARDRLYVCGFENKRGRSDGCWYDLIAPTVRELGADVALITGEMVTRVIAPQTAPPDGEAAWRAKSGVAPLPTWARLPPKPEPTPTRPLTPSRADDEPAVLSPFGRDDGARFKRGMIMHRLLQSLPDLAPGKREAAARTFVARPVLALAKETQDEIVAESLAVLDHPDFAHLFRPGGLAEVPIVGLVGDGENARAISGQIDRLVVADDAVTIVDFKTNRPPPARENDVAPAYLRQMAAYRWAVRKIYPKRKVEAVLLWTTGPRLMQLSAHILDVHSP